MPDDGEEARHKRAEELRRAIEEAASRPKSPREWTDRKQREAAEESEREGHDDG